jgi:alanine dehydrogenase
VVKQQRHLQQAGRQVCRPLQSWEQLGGNKLNIDAQRPILCMQRLPGVIVTAVGRNITGHGSIVRELFAQADLLMDASQRSDSSLPLVPNEWLADLPPHAVVCDLVVDPYLLDAAPPTVRSIEGIPRGNLDKYRFMPSDADWSDTIPEGIPTEHRRVTVTCYSWPGVRPVECMELYGAQLAPLLETLLSRGPSAIRRDGNDHERALHRGSLEGFVAQRDVGPHGSRGSMGRRDPT